MAPLLRGAKQTRQVKQPGVSTPATREASNMAATEEACRKARALHELVVGGSNAEEPAKQPYQDSEQEPSTALQLFF